MKYDFNTACDHSELLADNAFMETMSRIAMGVANLMADSADSAERLAKFDAYVQKNNINAKVDVQAQGLLHFENKRDTSICHMMRLLIKESSVSSALASGAVQLSELEAIGVQEGIITTKAVAALGQMGANTLATVAELNMK